LSRLGPGRGRRHYQWLLLGDDPVRPGVSGRAHRVYRGGVRGHRQRRGRIHWGFRDRHHHRAGRRLLPGWRPVVRRRRLQHLDSDAGFPANRAPRYAGAGEMKSKKRLSLGKGLAAAGRSQTFLYLGIGILLILFPIFDSDTSQVNVAAVAGVWILLALGLNIVVGYAGLLDLGYAAFFAIGSYAFAILASGQFNIHISFWILLPASALIAAFFGVLLGAPTLRLRGDYLAIVTLGFGEIVPRVFRNASVFTGGVNGIVGLDQPKVPPVFGWSGNFGFNPIPWYYLILGVIIVSLFLINNLRNSRLGRAWMAIREDEVAAAATGINTVTTKLLAFALGASF